MKPLFLSVDGIDGCGKTTAVRYLEHTLQSRGHNVKVLRGMGSGALGAVVRQHLFDNYLDKTTIAAACGLALLDCFKHVKKALDEGYSVICDRFIGTYYAYNVKGNQDIGAIDVWYYLLLNKELITKMPDLSLIIDVDIDIAKQRLALRPNELTHIDERPIEYFQNVANGYYEFFDYGSNHLTSMFRGVENNTTEENFKKQLDERINELLDSTTMNN